MKRLIKMCSFLLICLMIPSVFCETEIPKIITLEDQELNSRSQQFLKLESFLEFRQHSHEIQILVKTPNTNPNEAFLNARSIDQISNSSRAKVTIGCETHFKLFPYDSHICTLVLAREMFPVFCGSLETYEFQIKGYSTVPRNKLHGNNSSEVNSHVINILVERISAMQIFGQMYSPVLLLVILSWLTLFSATSFSIRIGCSLAMLLFTCLVTTILWRDIPRAAHGETTYMEYYFQICLIFVFEPFFTNIMMYWYASRAAKNFAKPSSGDKQPSELNGKSKISISESGSVDQFVESLGKWHKFFYFKTLKPVKWQVPIGFVVVNLIYWPYVVYMSNQIAIEFQMLSQLSDNAENASTCL